MQARVVALVAARVLADLPPTAATVREDRKDGDAVLDKRVAVDRPDRSVPLPINDGALINDSVATMKLLNML